MRKLVPVASDVQPVSNLTDMSLEDANLHLPKLASCDELASSLQYNNNNCGPLTSTHSLRAMAAEIVTARSVSGPLKVKR